MKRSRIGTRFWDIALRQPGWGRACWPILSETFGDNPPVATMIECNLIDPKYRIEIELTTLAP